MSDRGVLLERVALHQTRLRTPGVTLDPSGVALGSRGLVLLPTVERLVVFLSIYTRDRSFADLLPPTARAERDEGAGAARADRDHLEVVVVRSPMGTREIVVLFPNASTPLLDVVADVARLAGGETFTGSWRYFVQYRDRAAPFGYDAVELLRSDDDVDFALHHAAFTQAYARERTIDLAALVARLELRRDASVTAAAARPLWVSAEPGVATPLIAYFARREVQADVGVLELPPDSSFDDRPRRIALFRVAQLPARMEHLVTTTPGIRAFAPAGPSVAVEVGHRHPIHLVGLPVFPHGGLTLLAGRAPGQERRAIVVDRLPELAPVASLVGVRASLSDVATDTAVPIPRIVHATSTSEAPSIAVPLQLAPSVSGARPVTATVVPFSRAALLRRLAYAMPTSVLQSASIARVRAGELGELLVLRATRGVDALPLGSLFSEHAPGLYVLAGHDIVPACAPSYLADVVGASGSTFVFLWREPGDRASAVRAFSIDRDAFVPLAAALLEPESWGARMPVEVVELQRAELEERFADVEMASVGLAPLRGIV